MPMPRGAGQQIDLNRDPDAMRPKTTQHPGLIKRALSAYTGGTLGSGAGSGNIAGEKREAGGGAPGEMTRAGGTAGPDTPAPERSGWDTTKQVIQTVFPGTEPYFKMGQQVGDYLSGALKSQQGAQAGAGYAPSSPAQSTLEWAENYLKRQESL